MRRPEMMAYIYWLITASLFGLVIYLATIIYLPGLIFQYRVKQVSGHAKANSFFLVRPDLQASLVSTATQQDIVGLCLLDVTEGNVAITAHMPQGQWNLTIYDDSGGQAYDLNDIEAGTRDFTVELAPSKSLPEQLRGKSDRDEAGQIENIGWHAELSERRGIAVFLVPLANSTQRAAIESVLRTTRCEKK